MGRSQPLSLYFRLSKTVDSKHYIIFCQSLNSNPGPPETQATALPTESQPRHPFYIFSLSVSQFLSCSLLNLITSPNLSKSDSMCIIKSLFCSGTDPISPKFRVILRYAEFELSDWLLLIIEPIRPLQNQWPFL